MPSRWHQDKRLPNLERNLSYKAHIPVKKIPAFITLFNAIAKITGSKVKASEKIGLATATLEIMESDKVLSSDSARKILTCYNRLNANQNIQK